QNLRKGKKISLMNGYFSQKRKWDYMIVCAARPGRRKNIIISKTRNDRTSHLSSDQSDLYPYFLLIDQGIFKFGITSVATIAGSHRNGLEFIIIAIGIFNEVKTILFDTGGRKCGTP